MIIIYVHIYMYMHVFLNLCCSAFYLNIQLSQPNWLKSGRQYMSLTEKISKSAVSECWLSVSPRANGMQAEDTAIFVEKFFKNSNSSHTYNENAQNCMPKSFCFLKITLRGCWNIFKELHVDYDETLSGNHKIKFFFILIKMLLAASSRRPG